MTQPEPAPKPVVQSEGRTVNGTLKFLLETGPVLAFFGAYMYFKDETFLINGTEYGGFIAVTVAFIPVILAATAILWALSGRLSKMQVLTAILVIFSGGISFWFNDERFIKIRPTIMFSIFAAILFFGLARGRSYLEYLMEDLIPLQREGWLILTKRFAMLFAGLAVFNEIAWRSLSTEVYVTVDTFGVPIAIFAFFFTQTKLFTVYAIEEEPEA